jgi:MFS family permease
MPLLPTIGRTVGTSIKAARLLVRGSVRGGAWATRRVGSARARGAANEIGMIRLFDLHALSCAGDTLIAIGLAGTIFNVPLGEARGKVALYLLITMVPFALLAPVVGPLLDHFRHGRRYALAVTMLGRFFLAYVIADHLTGWGLYPAAFGVLALSRAYGVARSAAVPRLLPEGVGLSQVGARASVYGTFAGALVAPLGLAGAKLGPQWPLWLSMIIFAIGAVISLRLPPRADSDPPEAVPQPLRAILRLRRGPDRPLSGPLIVATLVGSASLRLLYGFLLLFLTFVVVGNQLTTTVLGHDLGRQGAVGLIGGALAAGTFLSTAVGTKLRIRRPLALQSAGLTITAGIAVLAAAFYTLPAVALLALVTAIFSGIAKLTIDASIQERIPERLRATAFAHSETILMIAWVAGGAAGIIPLPGRLGVTLAAAVAVLLAVRAGFVAARLHNERLSGRADDPAPTSPASSTPASSTPASPSSAGPVPASSNPASPSSASPSSAGPSSAGPSSAEAASAAAPTPVDADSRRRKAPAFPTDSGLAGGRRGERTGPSSPAAAVDPAHQASPADPADPWPADPWPDAPTVPVQTRPNSPAGGTAHPHRPSVAAQASSYDPTSQHPNTSAPQVDPTLVEPPSRKWPFGRRKNKLSTPRRTPSAPPPPTVRNAATPPVDTTQQPPPPSPPVPAAEQPRPDAALAPPGYHVYRPTSATRRATDQTATEDDF